MILASCGLLAISAGSPAQGRVLWSLALPDVGTLQPAAAPDGTIYVGAENRDLTNGKNSDGTELSPDQQNLYAVAPNGKLKWRFHTETGVGLRPTIGPDGTIYIVEGSDLIDNGMTLHQSNGSFDAIAPSGKVRWSLIGGETMYGDPAFGPTGILYIPSDTVEAYTPTGKPVWTQPTGGPAGPVLALTVSGPSVFFADSAHLYRAGASGGRVAVANLLDLSPNGIADGQGAQFDWVGAAPDGTIYLRSMADGPGLKAISGLWAFDKLGHRTKIIQTPDVLSDPAIGPDGTVYLVTGLNRLEAYRPNGRRLWSVNSGGNLSLPVLGPHQTVLVSDNRGRILSYSKLGQLGWSFSLGARVASAPAVGRDGTVNVATSDHRLFAIRRPVK